MPLVMGLYRSPSFADRRFIAAPVLPTWNSGMSGECSTLRDTKTGPFFCNRSGSAVAKSSRLSKP